MHRPTGSVVCVCRPLGVCVRVARRADRYRTFMRSPSRYLKHESPAVVNASPRWGVLHVSHSAHGVLHESSVHECLKRSLAFRKPEMTAVSGRMARADGL